MQTQTMRLRGRYPQTVRGWPRPGGKLDSSKLTEEIMHKSTKIVTSALVALTSGLFLCNPKASAGEFKNIHTAIPDAACVNVHSSPTNVNSTMGMETFEFINPVADAY